MWHPSALAKHLWPGPGQAPIDSAECGQVKLMVDGKEFRTTSKTLSAVEGSRLAEMIRTGADCVQDQLGVVHIYYDPQLFSILLHYLRTGRLLLRGHTPQEVIAEAENWRLPGLVALCQSRMACDRSATYGLSAIADKPGQSQSEDQPFSEGSVADASPTVENRPLQAFNDGEQRSSCSAAEASPVIEEKMQTKEQRSSDCAADASPTTNEKMQPKDRRCKSSVTDASPAIECRPLQTVDEDQQRNGDCAAGAFSVTDKKLQPKEHAPSVLETYDTSSGFDARRAFRCEELELMFILEAAEKEAEEEDVAVLLQKMRSHPSMRSTKENSEPLDAPNGDTKKRFLDKNSPCDVPQASEERIDSVPVAKKKAHKGSKRARKRYWEAKKAGGSSDVSQAPELVG